MSTERLTVAQALVRFLAAQHVERDGRRQRFFAGCFGIFGHGNVAGLGQALQQHHDLLPYHPARNEQAMVHIASGYARQRNRLGAFACTSSVGPGATNMVTGAALATVNRLPVLLLPGDTFAIRAPHPVLQQLEVPHDGTVSVNDSFRPVCRYFDRINRPEQLVDAAADPLPVPAEQLRHDRDVVLDLQVREKTDLLDRVADLAAQVSRPAVGDARSVEQDVPGGDVDHPVHHPHGRGLAAPGGPHQHADLSRGHGERERVHRGLVLARIALGGLPELERRRGRPCDVGS